LLSTHTAGVRRVVFSPEHNILISASWDSTLHIHPLSKPATHAPAVIALPAKPFSISLTSDKLVVALADRLIHIFELKPLEILALRAMNTSAPINVDPWQQRESSMKFMTRAVACMPNGQGYASSSIEGRISVEWFDPAEKVQAKKYAFKCHRETSADGVDMIYPVNCLTYNPVHTGTFASGGGDGHVTMWDGITKRRIRQYQKYPASIADFGFSSDGKYLAVGYSPGFEDGAQDLQGPIGISVRELSENEAKGKDKK
jgi:cell cycle arrest protein BUB3